MFEVHMFMCFLKYSILVKLEIKKHCLLKECGKDSTLTVSKCLSRQVYYLSIHHQKLDWAAMLRRKKVINCEFALSGARETIICKARKHYDEVVF